MGGAKVRVLRFFADTGRACWPLQHLPADSREPRSAGEAWRHAACCCLYHVRSVKCKVIVNLKVGSVIGILLLSVLVLTGEVSASAASIDLGTAESYSVLGATGVANTSGTTLSGDLGLSPGGLISGFPPGLVSGTTNDKNAAADQAQNDRMVAYNDARTRDADATFAGDNNGRTYTPGVYYSASAFALTGVMTLDSEGDSNAVFIFNIDAALNTAASSRVNLVNGTQAHNVFWRVLGAAGTGAGSTFSGTIISAGAVTLGVRSTLNGRALSAGTVKLADNTVQTVIGAGSANVPDAPTGVSATAGDASAAVTWTAPTSDGGSAITGYTVTSSPSGGTASTTGGTSATVSGLTNGTAYTFTVVATNTAGNSASSAASTAVTAAASTSDASSSDASSSDASPPAASTLLASATPADWMDRVDWVNRNSPWAPSTSASSDTVSSKRYWAASVRQKLLGVDVFDFIFDLDAFTTG